MSGPFYVSDYGSRVLDKDGHTIAFGEGLSEEVERANAQMVCAALNAVFYAALATGSQS